LIRSDIARSEGLHVHARMHRMRGRGTHVHPLTQWPEGRAPLGRAELRLLTSKHWIERGEGERLIPELLSRKTTAH
jgi:hypothetical protein